ncbi:Sfi1 spindle body [Phaffia rhodozyma]|uniref:Sfi1 spindle body n=1 Tax=Phaffia rhodozyma TaxID=264483 RepID=A0A0F7SFP1_PHARH|nr:Sfi1 spindle body [Phaffia rhodozyma]
MKPSPKGHSFELPPSIDIRLIDEIVLHSGPNSTTFLDIFRAYNRVLVDHGLDPSDDVVYYRFILKVGEIPGTDWQDRWSKWKSTSRLPHLQNRSNHMNGGSLLSSSSSSPHTHTPDYRLLNQFDRLEIGRQGEEYGSQEQEEEEDGEEESRSDDRSQTAFTVDTDPRTVSAVGWEPTRGTSTVRSLSPPQRTSTPLARQRHNRNSSQTPLASRGERRPTRPRSSMDSAIPPRPYPQLQVRAPIPRHLSPAIPQILYSPVQIEPPPIEMYNDQLPAPQKTTQYTTGPDTPDILPPPQSNVGRVSLMRAAKDAAIEAELRKEDEMREQAERFYSLGLMGRCWDVWKRGRDWVKTTEHQIDRARAFLLLGSSFSTWKKSVRMNESLSILASELASRSAQARSLSIWLLKLEHHQDLYERVAKDENKRTIARVWFGWKASCEARRRKRWEISLGEREGRFKSWAETNALRRSFEKWKIVRSKGLAVDHYDARLIAESFAAWRHLTLKVQDLRSLWEGWEADTKILVVGRAWDTWKMKLARRQTEDIVGERRDQRLLKGILRTWKTACDENVLQREFRRKTLSQFGFTIMKARMSQINYNSQILAQIVAEKKENVIRNALRLWALETRGRIVRASRESNLVSSVFWKWKDQTDYITQDLDNIGTVFVNTLARRKLHSTLTTWSNQFYLLQANQAKADEHFLRTTLSSCLQTWRDRLKRHRQQERAAARAYQIILKRRAWYIWKFKSRKRAQDDWIDAQERKVVRTAFEAWSLACRRSKSLNALEDVFTDNTNRRLTNRTIEVWRSRLFMQRNEEQIQVKAYNQKIVSRAFAQWVSGCLKHLDQQMLMECHRTVKAQETLRKVLKHWRRAAKESVYDKIEEAERLERIRIRTLTNAWVSWRDKHIEYQLKPIEAQVALISDRNTLDAALFRWESVAHVAAAIHFYKSHTKQRAMNRLRERLPVFRDKNRAAVVERKRIIGVIFETWQMKTRRKIAARPPPRLRGIARARPRLSTSFADQPRRSRGEI